MVEACVAALKMDACCLPFHILPCGFYGSRIKVRQRKTKGCFRCISCPGCCTTVMKCHLSVQFYVCTYPALVWQCLMAILASVLLGCRLRHLAMGYSVPWSSSTLCRCSPSALLCVVPKRKVSIALVPVLILAAGRW